jgi:hypothetical protein
VPKEGFIMTADAIQSLTTRRSRAWLVLFGLGILLVLNMLFLLIVGGGTDQFEINTGIPFSEVNDAYPTVVNQVVAQEKLLSVGYLGFALFICLTAYFPYRAGEQWAWYGMWIMPGVLGLTAGVMFAYDSAGLGAFYAAFAVISLMPLLMSRRVFFTKQ